jgi:hypothetical protein
VYGTSALALVMLTGCSSNLEPPDNEPTNEGVITSVEKPLIARFLPTVTSILIEGDQPCGTRFRITTSTVVLLTANNGKFVKADESELRVGARARGWHRGQIAESCPTQTEADVILIDQLTGLQPQ